VIASEACAQATWRQLAWGVALAVALAVGAVSVSRALTGWPSPGASPVSPVLCAILLGLAWRNTFGVGERLAPGLRWVTNTMLRIGIALVGLRLTFSGIGTAAVYALPVVAGCIAVALGVSMVIGRALGLSEPLRMLLAAGTAICGCTAIVAVTPVTRARPAETGIAMSCVVVLGCLGMFLYPWVANSIFAGDFASAGVFLGTSIHDTSQVIAASLIYSQQFGATDVPAVAAFTKLLRNLSLLLLVPLLAAWSSRSERREAGPPGKVERSQVLPAFLIWFVALAIVRTLADGFFEGAAAQAWQDTLAVSLEASELLLVCGMTAVGLSVSLRDLRGVGSRAFLAALIVALAVAATSVSLTLGMQGLMAAR
jgi:uncharacterized integral membrane protein (TIGR00698 family)